MTADVPIRRVSFSKTLCARSASVSWSPSSHQIRDRVYGSVVRCPGEHACSRSSSLLLRSWSWSPSSSPTDRVRVRTGPGPAPATQPTPAPTSTTSVIAGTRTVTYEPFTTTGIDPRLMVTSHVTGTCIRYSRGEAERFYFRCFGTGSGIYDPCFAGPQSTIAPLVCPPSPTSSDVVEFIVTSVTSDEPPSPTMPPWAMQLSSGQICVLVNAAWSGLGPYVCQPAASQPSASDCHTPAAVQPFWTAACQAQETDASPFTTRNVVTVWF